MGFVVGLVLKCEPVPGKDKLKVVTVDIGDGSPLSIVTNAPNIRDGTRTCIATIGTTVEIDGEEVQIKKTNVGGVVSEGTVCDSVMLGWAGGASGVAVQVPASCSLGSAAPTSKPRMDGGAGSEPAAPELSAKELKAAEKAARKAALAEKKAARKAAKESGGGKEGEDNGDGNEKQPAEGADDDEES